MKREISKKEFIFFLLIFVVGNFCLIGCGRKPGTESGKVIIRYTRWGNIEEIKSEKELLKQFEMEHPDIKVKFDYAVGDYWSKLQTQIAGGTAPDVWLMSGAYFHDFMRRGVIRELQFYIDRDKVNLKDYYDMPVELFSYQGKCYGFPRDFNIVALYYNKTLFDRAGIKYPDNSWTWNNFLEASKKLTRDTNNDGKIDQWGCAVSPHFETCLANFIWQNGGGMLNEDKTRCILDEPEAIEAVQFLLDLRYKYKAAPAFAQESSFGHFSTIFETGRVAMMTDGSWKVSAYLENKNLNFDIAPLPKGKFRAASANGLSYAIYAKTKHPDEAWELVKFLCGEKAQILLGKSGTSIPALKYVANSKEYLGDSKINKKVFLEEMEYARDLDFTEGWGEWQQAARRELDLAFLGKESAEEACREAAKAVNQILESSISN